MIKLNISLLPIKAHYFFFMAAMGPILPQTSVFGKQLGISPDVMGFITSVLPLMYILAKPAVGYLIDYFTSFRKVIFMIIIFLMTLSFAGFYLVPQPIDHKVPLQDVYNLTVENLPNCRQNDINSHESLCTEYRRVSCEIKCHNEVTALSSIEGYISANPMFVAQNESTEFDVCVQNDLNMGNDTCDLSCTRITQGEPDCVLFTETFWTFVVLMCLGTVGYNVANCVSDATCFDMLGDQTMKYGKQRVWGTIGFGLSALISGAAVNYYGSDAISSILPALIIMLAFCSVDVFTLKWLTLPPLTSSSSIYRDVYGLLKQRSIAIFLIFATLAGVIDSFIIYYMFWHLEEVARFSGYMHSIKLIEGCVVAAECLGGEILFFLISGKILKKIGYVHCLSFCFFMYTLRLGLISMITNPWYLVAIEFFMQGPTYALCYTCIVAYASAVSPPGTTATVQGLVAGMDDGVGFAIGSLIGGQSFKYFGGQMSFRLFSAGALIICACHILLRPAETKPDQGQYTMPKEQEGNSVI